MLYGTAQAREADMPALQIKDCPSDVYESLKDCVRRQNRSIAQQALTILKDYLGHSRGRNLGERSMPNTEGSRAFFEEELSESRERRMRAQRREDAFAYLDMLPQWSLARRARNHGRPDRCSAGGTMVVVDASALVEMAHRTPRPGIPLASDPERAGRSTRAPSRRNRKRLSQRPRARRAFGEAGAETLEQTLSLVDEFYPLEPLQQEALSEGFRLQHSTHDMFYFVLARRMAATLMTADRRLMELCTCNGVDCIEEAKVELNEERNLG